MGSTCSQKDELQASRLSGQRWGAKRVLAFAKASKPSSTNLQLLLVVITCWSCTALYSLCADSASPFPRNGTVPARVQVAEPNASSSHNTDQPVLTRNFRSLNNPLWLDTDDKDTPPPRTDPVVFELKEQVRYQTTRLTLLKQTSCKGIG